MKRRSNRTWAVLTYVPAVTWAIISLAPLLWILMLSLKPQIEWNSFPPTLFPKDQPGATI